MRILLAQLNPIVGDLHGNTAKIISSIAAGREKHADLILFPELVLTGYPPQDFLLRSDFMDDVEDCLNQIVVASKDIALIVGLPRRNISKKGKDLYNSAAVVNNGVLLGYQDKMLLPTYDVFNESRYFEPSHQVKIWEIQGKRIGVTICEDIWQNADVENDYHYDPVQELCFLKPDLVLNLSASPYNTSKKEIRYEVCKDAALALQCPVILCNQVGGNDDLIFDGDSLFISANGEIIQRAKGFKEDLVLLDMTEIQNPQQISPSNFIEDLYQALVLGVRDYFLKSGFKKACLGLSGGIDSAVVACIAAEALGAENVLGVAMPSRYSSDGSLIDAAQLAKNLRIEFKTISVEGPFESYLTLLKPEFGNKPVDHTEENLQARIRGMILMALSNKHGYIVLTTGNKSELALGYATLYGDMCGGLSVINDLVKRQVYAVAAWINRSGEIIPLRTITKPPSAELRPGQLDSDSLPHYDIVDDVVEAYVEEEMSKEQIVEKFGYSAVLVEELIKKIHRNEYKRRQSPLGLRVTQKAFTAGRHFPVVQRYR